VKVLLVNTLYPPHSEGGAERSVAQLARGLADAGVDVVATTLTNMAPLQEVVDGVRVRRLALRNLYWPYDGKRRSGALRLAWHCMDGFGGTMDAVMADVVGQERPDLIHAHVTTGFSLSVGRAAKKADAPLVQTVRDYSLLCARAAMFRKGRLCQGRCGDCVLLTAGKKAASARAAAWIAISESLGQAHQGAGYFDGAAPRIIGNAVAATTPTPRPTFKASPEIVFGFIGRLQPEKGVDMLLQAALRLEGGWRLRIAGRGEAAYVGDLQRRFADPRIEWLGQLDADNFYRRVDVVVAPALWAEPFGRVAAEAVAHGRGLIVARIGGLLEAAGSAPFVLSHEAGDLAGLQAAMRRVLAEPDAWRFETMANSVAAPGWTEAAVLRDHLALYQDVLARASSTAAEASQR
jgi:glycosyltransferase involved in cell wall biosynthesis